MFEQILRFFINNSRMNYTLFVLVFAVGVVSYIKTPKEIFPVFDLDMISVSGSYTGASIDTLNKIIVSDLEDDLKSVQGVKNITTIVNPSRFSIILELKKGINRYNTASKVKDIVTVNKKNLPSDMDEPSVKTVDIKRSLLEITISSNNKDIDLITKANELKRKVLNIKHISEVTIYGDSDKFYELIIDEKKLFSYGISQLDFYRSLKNISYIFPLGTIKGQTKHYFLSTYNGAKNTNELQNTQINIGNKTIYLKDVASVSKKYEDTSTLFSLDAKNAINVTLRQSVDGDATVLEQQVLKLVKSINTNSDILYTVRNNQSVKIKDRLNIVISNILLGIIIITLIVALLINTRMAFIIMVGIPTSFVIAAIYFHLFGYTINLISLIGVLLALGIIVDDAMVVSENIQQYVEEGMEVKEAAIQGAKDMVKPVTIASLTTLFSFLPLLMMSGTMGEVVKLIPIALSALIVASLIESFIFLPIHAAHTLKKDAKTTSWKMANEIYSATIHFLIRWKKSFLIVFIIAVPVLTVLIVKNSKFQMFPSFDSSTINITLKANVNTTLEQSNTIVKDITKELLKKKDEFYIHNIGSVAGYRKDSGGNTENYSYSMYMTVELQKLKAQNFLDTYITPYLSFYYDSDSRTRELKSHEISKKLKNYIKENKLKEKYKLEEISVVQRKVGPIKADVKIGLVSNDYEKVNHYMKELSLSINKIKGITSIANSTNKGLDELKVKVNNYGQSLGVTESYIGEILANKYLEVKKASVFDKNGILDINIQSLYKNDIENFKTQKITLPNGNISVLNEICSFEVSESFEKITKENGETNFYTFANVNPKIITASEVLTIIEPLLEKIKNDDVIVVLKGEAEKNAELKSDMILATSLAMVLIMISMLYLFNSFRDTFIVMSVIPYSLFGVFVGHLIIDVNIGMTSIIGALGLAGIVINDGIIMMTYLKKSKTLEEMFIYSAKRFRPIILTSLTTLIGVSSLIFFPTGQAVIFQPMAIALGFGLAWGTILNLIFLPTLYAFANKLK
jgi:HAE1 family hydrophobic/amphiphilic exporter-1